MSDRAISRRHICAAIALAVAAPLTSCAIENRALPRATIVLIEEDIEDALPRILDLTKALRTEVSGYELEIVPLRARLQTHDMTDAFDKLSRVLASINRPRVIIAVNLTSARAAKRWAEENTSSNTPILFLTHTNPVTENFVASLAVPGHNMSGVTFFYGPHVKALETIRLLSPHWTEALYVVDRHFAEQGVARETVAIALSTERKLIVRTLDDPQSRPTADVVNEYLALAQKPVLIPDMIPESLDLIKLLTAKKALVVSDSMDAIESGACAAVIPAFDSPDAIWARQISLILNGYPVSNIPVERPTKFRRVLNLDMIESLDINLSRAQIASFDVLYRASDRKR